MDTVVTTTVTTAILAIVGAIAATAVSVSLLFTVMGKSYGSIIAALENTITELRAELAQERKDCAERIRRLGERQGMLEKRVQRLDPDSNTG